MTHPLPAPLLLTFPAIEGGHLPLVGGKAFRLALLAQHHFQVPPGLVLTTAFFEAQLRHCQFAPLWAGSPDVAVTSEALAWLAGALKTRPLAPALLTAMEAALAETFDPALSSFAVRSSAVDEDARDHSFAGIHLTELGVPRAALPIAITRCWASALGEPALQYRLTHSMSIQAIKIAVLIQPMLTPTSAGVAFTLNPLTGSRAELVIEAARGGGQAVVGGTVQPALYRLANQPPDYPPLEAPPDGPLSAAELAQLAGQLVHIQALLEGPQDIEWANQQNTFYVLQARPAAAPVTPAPRVDVEWTRSAFLEFLPNMPLPLSASVLEQAQSGVMAFFDNLGLNVEGLGIPVKLILGRPYLNLTLLKRAVIQAGLVPGGVLPLLRHTEAERQGYPIVGNWAAAWQARRAYRQVLGCVVQPGQVVARYRRLAANASAKLGNFSTAAPPPALLHQLGQLEPLYRAYLEADLALTGGAAALETVGRRLLAGFTPNPAAWVRVLAGDAPPGFDPQLQADLLRLAAVVRQNPQFERRLTQSQNWAALKPEAPPEFVEPFLAALARHGSGAPYPADLGCPRYAEDPAALLSLIRDWVGGQPESGSGPRLGWRRGPLALVIKSLRRLLRARGVLAQTHGQAVAVGRGWAQALGALWAGQGWVAHADDIFWLTLLEIERGILVGPEAGLSLAAAVQTRRDTVRVFAQTGVPFSLLESQIPLLQVGGMAADSLAQSAMVGLPISPGQMQGTVQVMQSPTHYTEITKNTVLVLPSTAPEFLLLLHRAGGLIVETGGLLSHGSVIAREYGLPAVANIPQATHRLRTGDRVLIDGSTGVVQLLESAS
jgi:pyruvate,water dikinase